ncbi:prefoldin subunit alpha [Candidatus Woesearchaeota archaeon]|nr:prefoldin subunit alpha [Candidatus Woesearchaeota archaeon]
MSENKYLELQLIQKQVEEIKSILERFDEQIMQIENLIYDLQDFRKLKKGDNILIPLASGIFAKAKLTDNNNLKVNVGKNTVVEKDVLSTVDMLENQMQEISSYRNQSVVNLRMLIDRSNKIKEELNKENV